MTKTFRPFFSEPDAAPDEEEAEDDEEAPDEPEPPEELQAASTADALSSTTGPHSARLAVRLML